jgi:predicted dehydrogenase
MKTIRIAIVGLGNMGQIHARNILDGKIPRLQLAAIADTDPARLALFPGPRAFANLEDLLKAGGIDAVLIATPHYHHTAAGITALNTGLHVLIEKPISVHRGDCERLLAAHTRKDQIFAAMFNQRTDPTYRKLRHLIQAGELGEIRRVHWTVTNWFRTAAYYASSGWRATWAGEGGGVLLNQCPHNLDLFQWLFGSPKRVRGFCQFGRYHDIEVEDDVTAYFELANGAHATFVASTGEAPGTNRLEVAAERGKVVLENERLVFTRNEEPMSVFSRRTKDGFATPPTWNVSIPTRGTGGQHVEILQNFTEAILDGKPLIAPAEEGIHSVELANAILLSSWTDKTVDLPLDAAEYSRWLDKKIAESKFPSPPAGAKASQ